jgi:hypothetical protein
MDAVQPMGSMEEKLEVEVAKPPNWQLLVRPPHTHWEPLVRQNTGTHASNS